MQLELFPEISRMMPNWLPLEILCKKYGNGRFSVHGHNGKLHIDEFMWMSSYYDIQCYKHMDSRRYLNIDNKGNFYRYSAYDGKYHKIDKYDAFSTLFGN
jgi:hypothetical protein